MTKKTYIIGLIVIVIAWLIYGIAYGAYYRTPEEAFLHDESLSSDIKNGNANMKSIIETVQFDNKIVLFFVSDKGVFWEADFSGENVLGREMWKFEGFGGFIPEDLNPDLIIQTWSSSGVLSNKTSQTRVFFGITSSSEAYTIKVNGEIPTFKDFEINGVKYVLWYVVGGVELNYDKVNVTSD